MSGVLGFVSFPILGRSGQAGVGGMEAPGVRPSSGSAGAATQILNPPFFQFHYDHNRAQFYVEDATTASALKQVSRKITDRDNYKVVIIINSSAPPQSLQNELKPEEIEQLKVSGIGAGRGQDGGRGERQNPLSSYSSRPSSA